MELLLFSARLVLGIVFCVSAVPKLIAPAKAVSDVQNYRILPKPIAIAFGWALIPAEMVSGLALLSGYGARWAALAVLMMLVSFMAAVAIGMARKQNLTCTCFGLLYRERVGWNTQARDAILALMALAVALGGAGVAPIGQLGFAASVETIGGTMLPTAALGLAISLGWVAGKGWPRWMTRRQV